MNKYMKIASLPCIAVIAGVAFSSPSIAFRAAMQESGDMETTETCGGDTNQGPCPFKLKEPAPNCTDAGDSNCSDTQMDDKPSDGAGSGIECYSCPNTITGTPGGDTNTSYTNGHRTPSHAKECAKAKAEAKRRALCKAAGY